MKRIAIGARLAGVEWRLVRQGGEHELWQCGDERCAIPRHVELNEITARRIMKDLEPELGEGWWRT